MNVEPAQATGASIKSRLTSGVVRLVRGPHPRWLPLGVAVLLCLAPLVWFESGSIIQGADYDNPISPEREIAQILSGWNFDNLGQPSFRDAPRLFPYLTFWLLGEKLGLSPGGVQRAWFVALFLLAFISALILLRELAPRKNVIGWAPAVLALAYVFNPFTVVSWAIGHNVAYLAYAVAPLWIALLIRTLASKTKWTTGLALAATSLLFASSANNPPIVITMILIPSLLVGLTLLIVRQTSLRELSMRGILIILWVAILNAWWLLPQAYGAFGGAGYQYAGGGSDLFAWPNLANPVHFSEFLRGLGYWGLYSGYNGVPYFAWAASLQSPIIVLATFFLPIVVLLPLTRDRRPNHWVVFAASLFWVSLFFAKALNGPLGDLTRWMYLNIPGFFIFRSAYEKFAGLLFLAGLLALCNLVLNRGPGDRQRKVLLALTAVVIALGSWPLFTGDVQQERNPNGVQAVVTVPEYYEELDEWTQSAAPAAILVVPQTSTGYIKTSWGLAGGDPIHNYSELPVIIGVPEASRDDGGQYAAFIEATHAFDRPNFMRRLGIGYVLVRHDIDADYYAGTPTASSVESRLQRAGYERAKALGKFRIYRVPGAPPNLRLASRLVVPPTDDVAPASPFMLSTSLPVAEPDSRSEGTRDICLPTPLETETRVDVITASCSIEGPVQATPFDFRWYSYSLRRAGKDLSINLVPSKIRFSSGGETSTLKGQSRQFRIRRVERFDAVRIGNRALLISQIPSTGRVEGDFKATENGNGLHLLKVAGRNRIEDGSFEESLWNGANFQGSRPVPGYRAIPAEDATDGLRSLQLVSEGGRVATSRLITGSKPAKTYVLNFDYKRISGGNPAFGVWQTGAEEYAVKDFHLSSRSEWQGHETVFSTLNDARAVQMFFYLNAERDRSSAARFDNVRVNELRSVSTLASGSELVDVGEPHLLPVFDGKIQLHTIKSRSDLVLASSFEQPLGTGPNPIQVVTPGAREVRRSFDATEGLKSLELAAATKETSVSLRLPNFDPSMLYRVEMKYRNVSGNPGEIGVYETGVERFAYERTLARHGQWTSFSVLVKPSSQADDLILFMSSGQGIGATSRFDDLKISSLQLPGEVVISGTSVGQPVPRSSTMEEETSVLALAGSPSSEPLQSHLPDAVSDGVWVVLPQAYHSSWLLTAKSSDGSQVEVLEHARVDGFANGWFVRGSGRVSVEVKYGSFSPTVLGLAISATTIGLLLGLKSSQARTWISRFRRPSGLTKH